MDLQRHNQEMTDQAKIWTSRNLEDSPPGNNPSSH
jgi:hypothetical protein